MPCVDVYQKAAGPFPTYSQCDDLGGKYSIQSDDEFKCSMKHPDAVNDDACRPIDRGQPGCPGLGGSK